MGARSRLHERMVSKKLIRRLEKGDPTRMHSTNRLIPPGTLKRDDVRFLFCGWVQKLRGQGRLVTLKLAQSVCLMVREHFGLPRLEAEHEKAECKRLHRLLKEARKRNLSRRQPVAAGALVDNVDTLPMHNEDS